MERDQTFWYVLISIGQMSNLDISLGHVWGIISFKVTMPSVLALELLSTLEEILNQTSPKGHFLFVNECMYS